MYNNTAPNNATYKNSYSGASGWTYNDTTLPDVAGTGCINGAPVFQNEAAGDYRLKACAAVDSGTTLSWMTGALDLAGTNRIINSIVDMGAYEFVGGALECGLAANVTTVLAPSNVVFTATISGNTNGLYCWWDFGDGVADGANLRVVTNLYSNPGVYTVSLMASNAINEVATFTNTAYIKAWATNAYVWTNSPSPAVPYTNWATAARLIGTAVAAAPAGVTLWATNGTYSETAEILVNKGLTIRSVEGDLSGASNTIVRANASGYRVFNLSDMNAVLQGLTIRDGAGVGTLSGAGVNMSAGLVRDCIIRNNNTGDNNNGGGVNMTGGTVSNCVIRSNSTGVGSAGAGGVYASGGQLVSCQITDNSTGGSSPGGGLYLNGATLRNCLIARNSTTQTGGGVHLQNGIVESCTIASNSASSASGGGGIYRNNGTAGTVSNSVVYFNTASASTYSNSYSTTSAGVGYTCTTNPVLTGNNNITANPLFNNIGSGDYTLATNSPCIDVGANQAWMAGALDLAGNGRQRFGGVAGTFANPIADLGAYEVASPPPVLSLNTTVIGFGTVITNKSPTNSYTVSGTYLPSNVTVRAPANFLVATNGAPSWYASLTLTPSAVGLLAATPINVQFTPPIGGTYSGVITNSSYGVADTNVTVSGLGVVQTLYASPTSLAFGNAITNRSTVAQPYTLSGTNLDDTVTVTAPVGFQVSTNGTDFAGSVTLAPTEGLITDPAGATLTNTTVSVRFAPATPGPYSSSVTNSSTGALNKLVSVTGTGVVQGVSVSANLLAFGNVLTSRSVTTNYSVAGSNLSDAVVVDAPAGYEVSTNTASGFGTSVTLVPTVNSTNDPGGATLTNTTVWVKFAPPSTEPYNSSVTNRSVSALDKLVSVTGTGVVPGLSVVGGPFGFGNAITNKVSAQQTYTVSGSNLLDSVRVRTPSAEFQVSTNSGANFAGSVVLEPAGDTNAACGAELAERTVYVRFAPTTPGPFGGSITNTTFGLSDTMQTVSGTGVVQGLRVSETALAFGLVGFGVDSNLTYMVAGSNLDAAVVVSAPTGFSVSTNGAAFAGSVTVTPAGDLNAPEGVTLSDTEITVRFTPPVEGVAYSGAVTNRTVGAVVIAPSVSGRTPPVGTVYYFR